MKYISDEERKRNKIISHIIAVSLFIIPILFIWLFPTLGIILSLSGIIIWQLWNPVFSNMAKKVHKLLFKEEIEN